VKKIVLKGYITIPAQDLKAVQLELTTHIKLTKSESGCVVFDITQDQSDKHKYSVYEEFINQESFLLHQQRVKNSAWGKVTTNVERHYKIDGLD